jgi:hypothetical protein
MEGKVVKHWKHKAAPGNFFYLQPDGNLLGTLRTEEHVLGLPAKGGHMMELDWNGKVLWDYVDHYQHHDFRRCPNGNFVYVGWELLSKKAQKRVKGGHPGSEHKDGIYGDFIREITPDGKTAWEWHVDTDMEIEKYPLCPVCDRQEMAHANTIHPLPNGDFLISQRTNHLIGQISRKTKKFVWVMCDWILGHQHDVQPLRNGNILVFANGCHAPWHGPQEGSRIFEIDPRKKNKIVWEYKGHPPHTFDSTYISGVQRLWSGNTLICEGRWGRIFEVTPKGEIVWNYISPYFIKAKTTPPDAMNSVFRAYRYRDDSPEIGGRLPLLKGTKRRKPAARKKIAAVSKSRTAAKSRSAAKPAAAKSKTAAKRKPATASRKRAAAKTKR